MKAVKQTFDSNTIMNSNKTFSKDTRKRLVVEW